MLDFLHRIKATRKSHPLAKFARILSDSEAEKLQQAIALVGLVDPSKLNVISHYQFKPNFLATSSAEIPDSPF